MILNPIIFYLSSIECNSTPDNFPFDSYNYVFIMYKRSIEKISTRCEKYFSFTIPSHLFIFFYTVKCLLTFIFIQHIWFDVNWIYNHFPFFIINNEYFPYYITRLINTQFKIKNFFFLSKKDLFNFLFVSLKRFDYV